MRLHHHPVSPYCRKVLVAVYLRGDPVELNVIDPRSDLQAEWYRALSPFGKMPVLETDDGPLIESTSIIEYLEARGPRVLLPDEVALEARRFDRLGDLYLVDAQSVIWWRPGTPEAEKATETARTAWALFAERLAARPFVTGERFTLGDVGAAIATDYLERLGLTPPPAIAAWKERCFAIPAMARALDDCGPTLAAMLAARS